LLYRRALGSFDVILKKYPKSTTASVVNGAEGNPITYDMVSESLRTSECALTPAEPCLLQIARESAAKELNTGLQLELPQFALVAFGSIIAADRALGNIDLAKETSEQVVTSLASKPMHAASIGLAVGALQQLFFALAYAGESNVGTATYEKLLHQQPSPYAILTARVLSALPADLPSLQREIDELPMPARFYLLADLARQADTIGEISFAKAIVAALLSESAGEPQIFYLADVAEKTNDIEKLVAQASPTITALPSQWMPVALAAEAAAGDVSGALRQAEAIPDTSTRARSMLEVAIVQSNDADKASEAARVVEAAEALVGQPTVWKDPALALVLIEANTRIGRATKAVLMADGIANLGYRALALVRIALALSKQRHPFLFFTYRPQF
jgi:hypothetical protein